MRRATRLTVVLITLISFLLAATALAEIPTEPDEPRTYPLTFPVEGTVQYSDTWGAPRSEGRTHKGADIFAPKGTPVLSAATGTVMRIAVGERAGRYIVVEHVDGWRSYYLHLDNDTPGTDDGRGGAPAEGVAVGARVEAGDVLDFVGDSGNAEETPSHLHFELHRPDGEAINPTPHLRMAATSVGSHTPGTERPAAVRAPTHQATNTKLIGRFDPGGGFAAGIAVHDGVAYIGTWGRPGACPASGVRVIDVSNPQLPRLVSNLASGTEFPDTSTDAVWVGRVDTTSFKGTLAIVAVRLCDTSERHRRSDVFRGLAFYDTTDPGNPVELGNLDTGFATQGVHEIDAAQRDDGRLVVAATVMQSLLHTQRERGDLRLVDATDPRDPIEISDWDPRRDDPDFGVGGLNAELPATEAHVHSLWIDPLGSSVWLAAWDDGLIRLDIGDLASPRITGRTTFGANPEGNAHSVSFDPANGLLIRVDEDFGPLETDTHEAGWGGLTTYDASDPAAIIPLSTMATDNAGAGALDGFYTAHEVVTTGNTAVVSWYSDGVRVVDLTDPTAPIETASFVPASTRDPQRYWVAPDGTEAFPMVWGVEVIGDLIYATDMNSGLWIIDFGDDEELDSSSDAMAR